MKHFKKVLSAILVLSILLSVLTVVATAQSAADLPNRRMTGKAMIPQPKRPPTATATPLKRSKVPTVRLYQSERLILMKGKSTLKPTAKSPKQPLIQMRIRQLSRAKAVALTFSQLLAEIQVVKKQNMLTIRRVLLKYMNIKITAIRQHPNQPKLTV